MNPYETDKLVSEYLLFHYGGAEDLLDGLPGPAEAAGFARRCVQELLDPASLPATARALDIGCAVGASSFTLADHCATVLGIDYSHAFVRAAQELQEKGELPVAKAVEGALTASFIARLPEIPSTSQVAFEVGDAMALRTDLADFDVVLAANLICRLPEPLKFLHRLPSLVKPGGQLLLATPFTWLEDFTLRENWLGGRSPDEPRSFEALQSLLSAFFDLEETRNLPFLIREHARKFQYGVSLGSRWRRRSH